MASTDSEIGKFVAARPTCEAYSGTGAVINHFSANLGSDWKRLGRKLQLSKTDLDGIEVANPQVLEDQISDLFHLWKKRNGRHATAEALIAAAQSAGLDDLITTVHEANLALASDASSGEKKLPFSVSEYVEYLKGRYGSDLPLTGLRGEAVPVVKHVSLSLVTNDDVTAEEEMRDSWIMWEAVQDTARPTKKKKKPIDMKEVEKLIINSRVVVVEGAPGIGKSCLAWKLGVYWKNGELLTHYPLLAFLRFRDSSVQSAQYLSHLFPHPDPKTQAAVLNWIKRNHGDHCLLVLDGYDELSSGAQTDSIFSRIVEGDLLPKAHLVVTSRSSAVARLLDLCKTQEPRHIEILGFTEAQVKEYVCQAFKKVEQLRAFEEYLECHPLVQGLMYVPLNSAIVVHVYRINRDRGRPAPRTMTELYTALVLSLVYRNHRKRTRDSVGMEPVDSVSDLASPYRDGIKRMAGLAYHGCEEDKLVFHNVSTSMETFGLMESVRELHPLGETSSMSCNFLHKTLQEYLAAYHISLQPSCEQVNILENLSKRPQMKMVCRFLTGLTKLQGTNDWCSSMWGLFGYPVSLLTYAQRYHAIDVGCLTEVLHWLYEIHQPAVVKKVLAGINKKELVFEGITLSPFDCYVLGYCVLSSGAEWMLVFNRCEIRSKGVEMLLTYKERGRSALSCLRRLRLWENPINDRGAQCIGEAMKNNNCLTELELSTGGITSAALNQLCVSLHGNNTLTSLDISHNTLKDADILGLKQLLTKNRSLTQLNLGLCGIGPAGLKELCSTLHKNTTLIALQLAGSTFDLQSVEALGLAIKGNKSLSDLNLTKCCLDDSSIVRLCQSIMECHLKVLNICSNPFARQGALAVAQLMKTHEYIEQVWAWNADMHHESVCCLLDAMRANQRVKKLLLNSSCRDLIDTTELASLKGRVVFN